MCYASCRFFLWFITSSLNFDPQDWCEFTPRYPSPVLRFPCTRWRFHQSVWYKFKNCPCVFMVVQTGYIGYPTNKWTTSEWLLFSTNSSISGPRVQNWTIFIANVFQSYKVADGLWKDSQIHIHSIHPVLGNSLLK